MERYTQTSNSRCTSGRSVMLDIDDALEHLSIPMNRMRVTVKRSSTVIPEMVPNRVYSQYKITSPFSVQTYPSVLGIGPRKLSNFKSKGFGANNQHLPGLQRSRTILSTPCRHCDACSIKQLRNFSKIHYGTGIHIEDALMVHSMKRSKSDLQLHENFCPTSTGMRSGQERTPVFIMGAQEVRPETVAANKEEYLLPTTTIPKKGLIKLTALDEELADPELFSNQKLDTGHKQERKKSEVKTLIKRKDIRDQIREGNRLLEEEERKLQMEANIEDYTLNDLQSALINVQEEYPGPTFGTTTTLELGPSRTPKMPKIPKVTRGVKQQTFVLPMFGQKK